LVAEAPDMDFYGFSFGVEGEFTPKLTGIVSGGYEIRNYSNEAEIPDGWVASVQLRWQVRAKTYLAVGYHHRIEVSREILNASYTAHRPTLTAFQEIGTQGKWTVNLSGYYELDDYDEETISRTDNLMGVSLRANYRWQPWLVASAGYDYIAFDTDLPANPSFDYEVHRFSLRVAAGY
jgi:hypothetical protein